MNQPVRKPPIRTWIKDTFEDRLGTHFLKVPEDTLYASIQHQREEIDLFNESIHHGLHSYFRYTEAMRDRLTRAWDLGERTASVRLGPQLEDLRAQVKALRLKYEPLEVFQEELDRADWYYMYSDSAMVYKSGELLIQRLETKAKEGGPEYMALYHKKVMEINETRR